MERASHVPDDRLSVDLLRPLVEQSLGLMCVHDLEGNLLFVNAAAAETLGYRPADGVGWNLRRFLAPDIESQFDAYLERIRTAGVDRGLLRLAAKDGTERVWSYRNVLYEEAGRPPVVLGHAQDVTERIRAERAAKDAHERRIESLGVLAGGIAHEFNNLLAVVAGHAELLLARLPPGDPGLDNVDAIRKSAWRGAQLTHELLAFGRRQAFEPRATDLNGLVGSLSLASILGPRIDLTLSLEPGLEPARVDPEQLMRAIRHLAEHARDSMPEGGRLIVETANVRLDRAFAQAHPGVTPGACVRLTVRDTSAGLDEAARTRIFEPFFTARAGVRGSGLALAAVHGITVQHGGAITVDNAPAGGTAFTMYLPTAESVPVDPPPPSAPARGQRILLIAEEPAVRHLLRSILTQDGYHVRDVRDPAEALALAERRAEPIDLIVRTVRAGQVDEEDRVSLAHPGAKLLYMSAQRPGPSGAVIMPDDRGHVLPFPTAPATLLSAVRELLDRR